MSSSGRAGAAAYAGYGFLLAAEALWIAVGPRWFDQAREWAELHAFSAVGPSVGASIFLSIAWALRRGYRWAWYVGVIWGGLLFVGAVGLLLSLTPVFPRMEAWPPAVTRGPILVGGVLSLACLGTGVFSLCKKDARTAFLAESGSTGKPGVA
jgi:hypothetical protein